ncbi:MAG TPA: 4-(cytidine 5'-diphospho)-2-C-methyl-D-erythritol kinase [Trebonia sp.]|nr:4-(cytidine 5'-diphospho)-2-C-methyl-D-erythritol kinase [Trebonia sp.]
MTTSVTVRVPGKINLQLAVGPLRPDGYHDLVTVFHAVSLSDEVTVATADTGTDSVAVSGEGSSEVPADGDNLALRAVRALRAKTGIADNVQIRISKRIPVAAGMAGGSADAAGALVACDELWGTGLSAAELSSVAAQLGSDVPFALLGGTVVGRGRGERLTTAEVSRATYHWVLAYADGHLSTPLVYKTLDQLREGHDVPAPELSNELMAALRAGDPGRVGQALGNDLQAPALTLFPALRETLATSRALGALGALVSGSGPTCFFLARDAEHAAGLAAQISGAGVCRSATTATGPAAGASVTGRKA